MLIHNLSLWVELMQDSISVKTDTEMNIYHGSQGESVSIETVLWAGWPGFNS